MLSGLLTTVLATPLMACGSSDEASSPPSTTRPRPGSTTTDAEPAVTVTPTERPSATPPDRPIVVVVGDSITDMTAAALHARLDPAVDLTAEGVHGALAADMLATSTRLAALDPDVAVVNLGTNDATMSLDAGTTEAAIRAHLEQFASADCRWVVTLTERPDPPFRDAARETNARLRALAALEPTVGVIDWQAVLDADLAAGSPEGPLLTDDIHPTDAGAEALVGLIATAVDGPCG